MSHLVFKLGFSGTINIRINLRFNLYNIILTIMSLQMFVYIFCITVSYHPNTYPIQNPNKYTKAGY